MTEELITYFGQLIKLNKSNQLIDGVIDDLGKLLLF